MKKINITLIFLVMVLVANAQTYHEDDKEGLRKFLRQPSAIEGEINALQLGLQLSDTIEWYNNEDWISKIIALFWNDEYPKRLLKIGIVALGSWGWTDIDIAGNLDASGFQELETLICFNNNLSELDVSGCTKLEMLNCSNNSLTKLYLIGCTNLRVFNCHNNFLENLNLVGFTNLQLLNCSDNSINLDVSGCFDLKILYCSNNSLTNLDVSKCTKLESLNCSDNYLKNLDVHKNFELRDLGCSNNHLPILDLSENTFLEYIECYNNQIKLSNLYDISEKILPHYCKRLGNQILLPKTVVIGEDIDFSLENVLGGVATFFAVQKNGENAIINKDYNITEGIITFHTEGAYKVIMTNNAIVSHQENPVKVIDEFECKSVGIFNFEQEQEFTCYVQNGNLHVRGLSEGEKWSVYNVAGVIVAEGKNRKAEGEETIIILPNKGIYIIKTEKRKMKIVI